MATINEDSHVTLTELSLARKFSDLIKRDLTNDQLRQVLILNTADPDKSICHTHDFIDANEAMAEAMEDLFQKDASELIRDDHYLDLWNKCWSIAKENNFFYF